MNFEKKLRLAEALIKEAPRLRLVLNVIDWCMVKKSNKNRPSTDDRVPVGEIRCRFYNSTELMEVPILSELLEKWNS